MDGHKSVCPIKRADRFQNRTENEKLEMPHFKYFENCKRGAFRIKKHENNLKIENEPKIKIFDVGAFQIKIQFK